MFKKLLILSFLTYLSSACRKQEDLNKYDTYLNLSLDRNNTKENIQEEEFSVENNPKRIKIFPQTSWTIEFRKDEKILLNNEKEVAATPSSKTFEEINFSPSYALINGREEEIHIFDHEGIKQTLGIERKWYGFRGDDYAMVISPRMLFPKAPKIPMWYTIEDEMISEGELLQREWARYELIGGKITPVLAKKKVFILKLGDEEIKEDDNIFDPKYKNRLAKFEILDYGENNYKIRYCILN